MRLRHAGDFNARCSYNLEVILMILHHPIARGVPNNQPELGIVYYWVYLILHSSFDYH